MNIHEHQAKELLKQFNVPVLNGFVVYNQNELDKQIDTLKGPIWVVKAQIHAGEIGRAHV